MSQKWWVLAAVGCGTFMATLDASVVNVALPTLIKDLNSDLAGVKWVILIHLFTITCLLLPMGKLADFYGRRRVAMAGFIIFALGSFACGIAPTLGLLIFSRFIQGIGTAALMSNGPAIIASTFGATELGKALGTLSMIVSAGLISGPAMGGLVITSIGWRMIFLLNLPLGMLGFLILKRRLEKDHLYLNKPHFDWMGAVVQTLMLCCLILLFDSVDFDLEDRSWLDYYRYPVGALVLGFAYLFYRVEKKAEHPLCDFSLLRDRTFWSSNLAAFLNFISFSSVTVLMPFFFEEAMSYETRSAGLLMTAIPLTVLVVAPLSGRIADRIGSRWLTFIGTTVTTIGLFVMAGAIGRGIQDKTDTYTLLIALAVMGVGNGLFQTPNNAAIMQDVPRDKLGAASAFLAAVRNLGLVVGAGLATGLFVWRYKISHDFVSSLHFTHMTGGIFGAGAMIASLMKRR